MERKGQSRLRPVRLSPQCWRIVYLTQKTPRLPVSTHSDPNALKERLLCDIKLFRQSSTPDDSPLLLPTISVATLHLQHFHQPPPRRVDNDPHQAACNYPCHRQRDDPPGIDPQNHLPVDSPPCPRAQTYTHSCASYALGRADRQRQPGRQDDRDCGSQFHAESS